MADNFDSVRKKRMEELEAKKRRLEEMRKSKKERETEDEAPPPAPLPATKSQVDSRAEVDDLVKSLLGETSAPNAASSSSSLVAKGAPSSATKIYENGMCTSCGKPEHLPPAPPAPAPSVLETPPPPPPLPIKPESYDKNTQTDPPSEILAADSLDEGENDVCPACRRGPPSPSRGGHRRRLGSGAGFAFDEDGASSRRGSQPGLGPAFPSASASISTSSAAAADAAPRVPLTPEQEAAIVQSADFGAFLQRSARAMERVLHQAGDPLKDYRSEQYGAGQRGAEGTSMTLLRGTSDPAAQGRPVTALAFSPHHPELFCAAFGASPSDDSYPGCVLVFSTTFPGPEFFFSATSPVLCAAFHPTDPHLLLGACYSGQVVCWDMRGGDRGAAHPSLPRAMEPPLQRRASTAGHKHPIYAMSFASPGAGASSSGLELVTVSTDGCLCHWDVSPATLKGPLEPLFSSSLAAQGAESCPAISSLSFAQHPSAAECQGIFGTGTGQLYRCTLPHKQGARVDAIEAHCGLVTSIRLHPSPAKHCRSLLLTASLDWTVKLWNLAAGASPVLEFRTGQYDYVCDVCWCPVNPGVFATATTGGVVSLWNLARSLGEPVDVLSIGRAEEGAAAGASKALNRLAWSRDGRVLVAGDCGGRVWAVAVREGVLEAAAADGGRFELAVAGAGAGAGPVGVAGAVASMSSASGEEG